MEIFKLYIVRQSPMSTPTTKTKNEWVGAAIGAGATILSGIFSSSASRKAADNNLQAVRETNETNKYLAEKQNQWNLEQWNRENEYNSPEAQMMRYKAAGINPYMAMGNITSGNASSLQSAELANQQPATTDIVPDYSFIGQAGTSFATLYNQTKLNEAQVDNVELDADLKRATLAYNTLKAANEAKGLGLDNIAKQLDYDFAQKTFNEREQQTRLQTIKMNYENNVLALSVDNSRLDNAIKSYYKDNIQPLEAQQIQERINNMIAETYATYQEVYRSNRLADWQIKQCKADIAYKTNLILQGWKQLDINQQQANTSQMVGTSQANLNDSQSNLNQINAVGAASHNNVVVRESLEKLDALNAPNGANRWRRAYIYGGRPENFGINTPYGGINYSR